MTDLDQIPVQDGFETTLAQELSTSGTTIYLKAAPSYLPITTDTYITINPKKSIAELIKVTSYDASAKTFTVDTRAVARTLGVTATAQTHTVGSTVIISDNFTFWSEIQTAVNSKIDTADGALTAYADATARDAAITSPANGMQAYLTDTGKFTDYTGGSWVDRESGGTFPNASVTAAGKAEIATSAETQAGTDTGGTGAKVIALPSDIAANEQSSTFVYAEDGEASDTYVISLTPNLTAYTTGQRIRFKPNTNNTGACTINVDSIGAKSIKLIDGTDPLDGDLTSGRIYELVYDGTNFVLQQVAERATDAEATTGTNTTNYITPKQAKDNYDLNYEVVQFTRDADAATGTVDISHTLGIAPKNIIFFMNADLGNTSPNVYSSQGAYDGTNNKCSWKGLDGANNGTGNDADASIFYYENAAIQEGAVSATSTTNFTVSWTKTGSPSGPTMYITALVTA